MPSFPRCGGSQQTLDLLVLGKPALGNSSRGRLPAVFLHVLVRRAPWSSSFYRIIITYSAPGIEGFPPAQKSGIPLTACNDHAAGWGDIRGPVYGKEVKTA